MAGGAYFNSNIILILGAQPGDGRYFVPLTAGLCLAVLLRKLTGREKNLRDPKEVLGKIEGGKKELNLSLEKIRKLL